jgi:hypothetical protein
MKSSDEVKSSKYPDLTIEDVRACEKFKDLSDEQAQQVIDTIRTYTEIIYTCHKQGRLTKQSDTSAKIITITKPKINRAA